MICRCIEDNTIFNYEILGISVHLWNADNDFREDLDVFDEDYEIID
jgi:hypothetical protein